jgi:hypothetical protein
MVFDSEPLTDAVDLLGSPRLRLRLASSAPVAKIAARLCEVGADGRSWLISYGVLNLTHRVSHAAPEPLEPGCFYAIELPLHLAARSVAAGRCLRLSLSEGLWPLVWPSPEPASLTIDLGASSLELPQRRTPASGHAFEIPPQAGAWGAPGAAPRISVRSTPEGWIEIEEVAPPSAGTVREAGTRIERSGVDLSLRTRADDPNTGEWRASQTVRYSRGDWDCALEARVELSSTATSFRLRERLRARLGDRVIYEREDDAELPRDLM